MAPLPARTRGARVMMKQPRVPWWTGERLTADCLFALYRATEACCRLNPSRACRWRSTTKTSWPRHASTSSRSTAPLGNGPGSDGPPRRSGELALARKAAEGSRMGGGSFPLDSSVRCLGVGGARGRGVQTPYVGLWRFSHGHGQRRSIGGPRRGAKREGRTW